MDNKADEEAKEEEEEEEGEEDEEDQQITAGSNLDAILNESLIHLITSKLDQNIIHKLDQKHINRSTDKSWIQFRCNIKSIFNASKYI